MPFEVSWLIEDKVMQSNLFGELSIEDLEQLNVQWNALLNQASSKVVHSVVNAHKIEKYPTSIMRIYSAQSYLKHPRLGWVIVEYGISNSAVNMLMTMLKQVFNVQVRMVESQAEALAYLKKVDHTLSELNG